MADNIKQNKLIRILLICYWIILFTATTLPSQDLPKTGVNDKIEHFTAYGILSFLLYLNFVTQSKYKLLSKHAFLSTLIFIALYGAFDELHQIFIPGRSCDIFDFISDFSGSVIFLIIAYFVKNKLFLTKNYT